VTSAIKKKILLIEDEAGISMAVRDELEFEGYEVKLAEDGLAGRESILHDKPDLVVLDLMLPGKNGFEISKEVRRKGIATPIIMLTARTQEPDKVKGLDLGADDYVIKPFSLAELTARVRAVLRRTEKIDLAEEQSSGWFQLGQLRVNLKKHEVLKGRERVELTHKEFQLLELLSKRPGEVISRDQILDSVWGEEVYVTHRTVDSHVATLRKKIETEPDRPQYILTVRGVGYKLSENPTHS
jgi:DNA-binding response OmpR family regulator